MAQRLRKGKLEQQKPTATNNVTTCRSGLTRQWAKELVTAYCRHYQFLMPKSVAGYQLVLIIELMKGQSIETVFQTILNVDVTKGIPDERVAY